MKKILGRFLSSYLTTIILLIIYAITMALATIVEKYQGTPVAKALIYYSPLFFLIHILMILNLVFTSMRFKLFHRNKWSYLIVHFSFVVILLGAFITFTFGKEGIVHIRQGEISSTLLIQEGDTYASEELPFKIELKEFILTRYPGSQSPSSFESILKIHFKDGNIQDERVFMNNTLDLEGYRFFQASYDPDEKGTILSVNQDWLGRTITYLGYVLLFCGLIACLFDKSSRFQKLYRAVREINLTTVIVAVLMLGVTQAQASSPVEAISVIPIEQAEAFGHLAMQTHSGRMVPINTFSSEVLRKITKKQHFKGLNSDQFLLSLLTMPEKWVSIPIIKIDNNELKQKLGLVGEDFSYLHFFSKKDGKYILASDIQHVYHKSPDMRTKLDKELIKLDEKINTLHQLFNKKLVKIYPLKGDSNDSWFAIGDEFAYKQKEFTNTISLLSDAYLQSVLKAMQTSDWSAVETNLNAIREYQKVNSGIVVNNHKLKAEVLYNKLDLLNWVKKGYLISGALALLLAFISIFGSGNIKTGLFYKVLISIIVLLFALHTSSIGMRGYISGYAPWSNSYETMVYIAWATVLGGLLFARKNCTAFAIATIFAGIVLFVSSLNWMDPQISPLVPVLKSPWLMFHVAVIVAAYGFFGISSMLSFTNLLLITISSAKNKKLLERKVKELTIINEMQLIIGLVLMTIGTFLGAIWANESWGRYWGWDPKETWALITMIVYAIVLHMRLIKRWKDNIWLFNMSGVLAFLSVIMTYFGVNYLLSGMHSYGNSDVSASFVTYLSVTLAIIILLGLLSFKKGHKWNE